MTSTSALPGTTILNLPISGQLSGQEWVPGVQGGTTVRIEAGALSGQAISAGPFVVAVNGGFAGQRILTAQSGVTTITDNGAGSTIVVGIATNGISSTQLRKSAALSVMGNQSTSSQNVSDIAGTANQVLTINSAGSSMAFGQVNLSSSNAVSGVLGTSFGGTGSSVGINLSSNFVSGVVGIINGGTGSSVGVNLASSALVTNILPVPNGGTGLSSFVAYQIITGGTVSSAPLQSVTAGTSGNVMLYNTAASLPSWQPATNLFDTIGSSQGQILYRSSTAWTALTKGTSAQVLTGGSTPAWAAPSAGGGTVTAGTGGQFAYYSSAGNSVAGSSFLVLVTSNAFPRIDMPSTQAGFFLNVGAISTTASSGYYSFITINGAANGVGAGSLIQGDNNGNLAWAIGNYSAINGTSFDNTLTLSANGNGYRFTDFVGPGTVSVSSIGVMTVASLGQIPGASGNSSASAGNIGEYVSTIVSTGSPVTLAAGVASNIASINLTAGDWDVSGATYFMSSNATSVTSVFGSITTSSSGAANFTPGAYGLNVFAAVTPGLSYITATPPVVRITSSIAITAYLTGYAGFTVGGGFMFGAISARRAR